ncbi:hypothetical protein [Moorena producens]
MGETPFGGAASLPFLVYHIGKILWDSYPALPIGHLANKGKVRGFSRFS